MKSYEGDGKSVNLFIVLLQRVALQYQLCGGLLAVFNYIWIGPSAAALLTAALVPAAAAAVAFASPVLWQPSPAVPLMSNSLYLSRNRRLYR